MAIKVTAAAAAAHKTCCSFFALKNMALGIHGLHKVNAYLSLLPSGFFE